MYDALALVDGERKERAGILRQRIAPSLRDLFYTDRRYQDLSNLVVDPQSDFRVRQEAHAKTAAGPAAFPAS